MPESLFILYSRGECGFTLPSNRWIVRYEQHPIWKLLPTTYWVHYRLANLARSDDIDVFWAPNTFIPRGLPDAVRTVATVLDFRHILEPENMPPITLRAHRNWFESDVRRANRVVAISEGTSKRMQDLLGRRADAIALPAVATLPRISDSLHASQILAQLGVYQPFLLTVGRSPCKNLEGAIAAVALLKSQGRLADHQLVLAGAPAWVGGRLLKKRDSAPDWIKPLGHVEDDTLSALYSLADSLIFPSFYEGFGMPVLEARAMGCRVITTNAPELREAGGDDATYVEPTPQGIAEGLKLVLGRPAPEIRNVGHDWSDAAKAMAAVFRSAAGINAS